MTRKDKARELFLKGNNCAQAVFAAFCDVTKLDENTALLIASSFGGGMGHIGEACGAATGMFMAAGLIFGYGIQPDADVKKAHSLKIRNLADKFKKEFGEIRCPALMKNLADKKYIIPEGPEYTARPCLIFVEKAVEILEESL